MQQDIFSALKENAWLKHVYDQAPVAIGIYTGPQHIIEFANPRMLEIWGRSAEDVVNRPLFEALPEVSGQGFEEILANTLETGAPFKGNELPATLRRNDSLDLAYFNILYEPLRNENGEIYGIFQTATEVTELVEEKRRAEQREEVMQMAMEAGKMAAWHVDLIRKTFSRSNQFDKIFGFEDQPEWNEKIFFDSVHPGDRSYAKEQFEKGLKCGALNYEARIMAADDLVKWVHIRGKATTNLKGDPISISGIVIDITENKKAAEKERQLVAEQAARWEAERQQKTLKNLFMKAPAIICTFRGPDHVFDLVNPRYQSLFPGRKLQGKPILKALPELKDQPILKILDNVYKTGEPYGGNEIPILLDRFDTGDLKPVYFNFVYQPIRDEMGKITGILVFAFEVTDHILARKQIEASETRLKLALEAGKMGTWNWNLTTDNFDLYGLRRNLISGENGEQAAWNKDAFLQHVISDDRETVKRALEKGGSNGSLNFEVRVSGPGGDIRWILVKGQTFYENQTPVEMAGIVTDITERKQADEKLNQLTRELAESNRELYAANDEIRDRMEELTEANRQLKIINADLDNFIYSASHDLKAPITNIEGLISGLIRHLSAESLRDDTVKKLIELIEKSIERLKKTISELSDIAKSQKEVEEVSTVDLAETIREVLLDLDGMIGESAAEISVEVDQCPRMIFSHKNLKSIIYNLVSNAIKYRAPERKPLIFIACRSEGDLISLTVKDNGLGIKEQHRDKIFQMFKRAHNHVEGSGVGLYLVKRIMDNAGGKLEVESREGYGSTFKVFFKNS